MPDQKAPKHFVAVVGGATAGAEVASRLAARGILVAVFEQNDRPYGKIEDGLPRWHEGLRHKEYQTIREKLSQEGVYFVPHTKIGRDIAWKDLVDGWGFTCVVLANGAWRDRPLPIEGSDAYVGKGLVYQNPFVIAFNHAEDPSYQGEKFEIFDDSIVVGGGLASIDVAKIVTLSTTREKLRERGIDVSITELEVKGIPKTLAAHGLEWKDLGLAGCTIYYRRRVEDMPLVAIPDDAPPERVEKIYKSRRTLLEKAMQKFFIKVEPLSAPDGLIVEDGRLVGLRFRRTRVGDGKLSMTDETFERRGPVVISSIGSIPEPIEGIAMKGELFDFSDWRYGRLAAYPTVFSVGNVVTGKGNIVASRKHAQQVSEEAIEAYLGVAEGVESEFNRGVTKDASEVAENIGDHVESHPPLHPEQIDGILKRIGARQGEVGFEGSIDEWFEKAGEPC
jgi:NADPH-dependent glutamate synthase beta subunit-like oxidoreductase